MRGRFKTESVIYIKMKKCFIIMLVLVTAVFAAGCGKGDNLNPIATPTETAAPANTATDASTDMAVDANTDVPTNTPTVEPAGKPTNTPTVKPTSTPTSTPTSAPAEVIPEGQWVREKKYNPSMTRVIEINTLDGKGIETKEEWRSAEMKISSFDEGTNRYVVDDTYTCEYKGRGNSTWKYNKKPFNVKFEEKTALLGMNKGKRYSFIANWLDRSAMRNYVTYQVADMFTELNYSGEERKNSEYIGNGWKWSPMCAFAEVYVDGKYAGLYLVTESIKIADNRLELVQRRNITDENGNETDAAQLGPSDIGMLFEMSIDGASWETEKYADKTRNTRGYLPYNVKEPDYYGDLTSEDRKYAKQYIDTIEDIIFAEPTDENWEKICAAIDVTSFADFWLVQAIAGNEEPGHPKSVFMYKNNDEPLTDVKYADELGGKLYAGPVWDFDWGTYNLFAAKKEQVTDVVYYSMLFQYMQFKMILEERWKMIRPRIVNDIPVIIDEAVSRISPAVENDDMLYPYKRRSGNNVNYDSLYSYSRSIKSLKDYLKQRVETIDSQVFLNMSETS